MNKVIPNQHYSQEQANPANGEEDGFKTRRTQKVPNSPPARQSDLVELHKRIVAMFTTLREGLGDQSEAKAARDRKEICERLDELEQSMNCMEGMLRIEMTPQIRSVLNEALEECNIGVQSRWRGGFFRAVLLTAGVVAGVVWSAEITQAATAATAFVMELFNGR